MSGKKGVVNKDWPPEELAELFAFWKTNGSVLQFARAHGRTQTGVYATARRYRLSRKGRYLEGPRWQDVEARIKEECAIWGVDLDTRQRGSKAATFVRAKTYKYFMDQGHTLTSVACAAGVHHTTVSFGRDFLKFWTDERFQEWRSQKLASAKAKVVPVAVAPKAFRKITHRYLRSSESEL